jgi:hypothetical protein
MCEKCSVTVYETITFVGLHAVSKTREAYKIAKAAFLKYMYIHQTEIELSLLLLYVK